MSRSSIPTKITRHWLTRFGFMFVFALGILSIVLPTSAYSAQVTVGWNESTGTVTGYKVYYGPSSGNYTFPVRDAGNALKYTIPDDLTAPAYYVTVTAYDDTAESSKAPELVIYSTAASAGTGGSVSPGGTFYAEQDSAQTFTITPDPGYRVASVTIDGSSVGAVTSYTLNNIAAAHSISATFAAIPSTYTITASAGANGSISPSPSTSVTSGADQTFTITPNTGYKVASVTVDGTALASPVTSYTFTNVTANHSISATFAINTFTITSSAGANGSISPSASTTVNYGANQTFTITPNTGYKVASVTVDGTALASPVTSYTFSNVTAAHSISATFAVNTFTITSSAGANGSISPSASTTVNYGASQTFTITPNTGYKVASVTVDGTALASPVSSYTFSNVTAAHSISATFAVNTFTITSSAGANGSISPSASTTVNYGASQTFTITPNTGYTVASVTVDGTALASPVTSYTFTNVTAAHSISATFAVNTFTITSSAGANGSISPSASTTVNYGANQTFTITPNTGYTVASVTVDGTALASPVTSYSFSNVTAVHSISATFAVNTFTITATAGANGSISPSASTTVNYGASQTFTITPNTGYTVASVTVDGTALASPVTSYSFSNVTAVHSISATFAVNTFTITATAGANGSISPSASTTVNYGASQTFTITPNTGYTVASVTVDGTALASPVTSYTFTNVTAAHSISATFAINTFTITASAGANGSISPSASTTVNYGASQTFTITPNTGYKVASVTVDGTALASPVTSYTFTNVTAAHSISATFAINTFTITASAGANGSISPSASTTVNYGASRTFTITPNTGCTVASVTVDGTALASPVTSYTFSNVTAAHSISATFAINTITITSSAGANGSISPSASTTVNYGASQTFTITPNTGYTVASVTVDGTALASPVTSYTFSNVTAAHSISATFAVNTFTITSSAGANGSISPSASTTVNYGASQTFTITPNTGYTVASVTVDGTALASPVTSYTFTNVTAAHSISATFSQANQPPVADAGPTQTLPEGTLVTLNGTNSTDPGNSPLSYLWTQTGGTLVSLSSETAAQPAFTAPDVGTSGVALTFQLTVTNQAGLQSSDTCVVNVTWSNGAPTAKAGPNQTVPEGTPVTLDGSNSTDPDDGIASYLWQQIAGPAVTLTPTTPSQAIFVAPDAPQAGTSLTFQLTVKDNGGLKSTATSVVNVTWVNSPPQANAGQDQSVYGGDSVVLDGAASSDPDDGLKSYLWKQTSGPPVTLTNPAAIQPAFAAPSANASGATLGFLLTVTDNGGLQSTDTCNVYVKQKQGADLTGSWQTLSYNGYILSGSFKTTNSGNQKAGTSLIRFYLSNDGTTPGKLITQNSFSLGIALSKTVSFRNLTTGVSGKYVIAVIDANNNVVESNEQNNKISAVIPVPATLPKTKIKLK